MTGPATAPTAAVEWPAVLDRILAGEDLAEDDAAAVMRAIMSGEAEPAPVAAVLVALRSKGESAAEIAGFVRTMVEHATPLDVAPPLLDTCGTGGDGRRTFNISTVTAVVAAAAGVRVAKHGNRAASGVCGSADLLEAWGVAIELPPEAVARTIDELGIGFLYARSYHPAMRHVAPIRRQLGVRTVFNVLGPLSNPAGASHQAIGVADPRVAPVVAEALARVGKQHVLVFHGEDGLDELTTTAPSRIWEVRGGQVRTSVLDPRDLGIARASLEDLRGGDVATNVAIADAVLAGEQGPPSDVVALNSAAALYAADAVDDLAAGLDRARAVLASGEGARLRDRWVARSRELAA